MLKRLTAPMIVSHDYVSSPSKQGRSIATEEQE